MTSTNSYAIELSEVEDAIPMIVSEVMRRKPKIHDLSVTKPSLEQVFLQMTGQPSRDTEALQNVYGQQLQIERMK